MPPRIRRATETRERAGEKKHGAETETRAQPQPDQPALGGGNDLNDRRSGTKGAVAFSPTSDHRAALSTLPYKSYSTIHFNSQGHRAVHDFCTASDRGLAVIGGVCVPDLVEAKAPLDLARFARIACSVRVDWLHGQPPGGLMIQQ
jgi:hypothetical protein